MTTTVDVVRATINNYVFINNYVLVPDRDYTVNTETGVITFRSTQPNSIINVVYRTDKAEDRFTMPKRHDRFSRHKHLRRNPI